MVGRLNRFRALRQLAGGTLQRCCGWWASNAEDVHLVLAALDPAPVRADLPRGGATPAAYRR
jgi:hypothetical protein